MKDPSCVKKVCDSCYKVRGAAREAAALAQAAHALAVGQVRVLRGHRRAVQALAVQPAVLAHDVEVQGAGAAHRRGRPRRRRAPPQLSSNGCSGYDRCDEIDEALGKKETEEALCGQMRGHACGKMLQCCDSESPYLCVPPPPPRAYA